MSEGWEPIRRAINELLAQEQECVTHIVTAVRSSVPEYAQLATTDIAPGVQTSVRVTFPALRDRHMPTEAQAGVLDRTGERRARQGLGVEPVLRAIRFGIHAGWELVAERARSHGAQAAELLMAHEQLWLLSDLIASRTAAAHRRAELRLVRREHQHHVDMVRGVLLGRSRPDELANQVLSLGLDLDHPYVICRARTLPPGTLDELETALLATGDDDREPVLASLERDVIGLLPWRPQIDPETTRAVIGVSEPMAIGDAPLGFRLATRAAQSALRFGLTGVHDLRTMAVRAAVANDPDLTRALVDAFVEPLRSGREFDAELERSVVAYLEHNLRLERTAEALNVHPNTLRQRLRRYTEITGADLHRVDDLVSVWWAFRERELR
ncbi:MAG TPA: helix-turn-helix domain-containing protein [Baekduia sp.]|uniref:PucR family transcriptional regulator n=1 Tax=Baekduia sp. TaxID=2600305 RepID=UPI002B56E216|nr:helix-turn-helix domain-containing protein [Baekduia sp.]HMJ36700.1 helix-turn-helix domain-containing protein [Baekduia sp.]